MAYLSEERWFYLAQMISTHTVLEEEEKEEEENFGGSKKPGDFRLEKVFPVYAVGVSEPDPNLVVSVAKSGCKPGDPIWDAVREEAKLEVYLYTCSILSPPIMVVFLDE